MCRFIFILLILIPAVEITGLTWVISQIGFLDSFALICITALLGLVLFRRQGSNLPMRLQRGEIEPTTAVLETTLITLGAVFLIIPGFVTDLMGLVILIGPIRKLMALRLSRVLTPRTLTNAPSAAPAPEDIIVIKKKEPEDR